MKIVINCLSNSFVSESFCDKVFETLVIFSAILFLIKSRVELIWSKKCILVAGIAANQELEFKMSDTKLYVPVVILSTQDNVKLFKQLESGFKSTINCNKYQSKITNQVQNRYLDFLIDAHFRGWASLMDISEDLFSESLILVGASKLNLSLFLH